MKTSFYFVLWILIYPILGMFHNQFINEHSFVVALFVVWGLSWVINQAMPHTLAYERIRQTAPILEDVYTGNVASFAKGLSSDAVIESVSAVYFLVTTLVIATTILMGGTNGWIALIVFGFFTIGAISRSAALIKAKERLKVNPTSEQCAEIATATYRLNYASFYESHCAKSYEAMLPSRPRHYKAFQIFSLVVAGVAAILGLSYIISDIKLMLFRQSIEVGALAGMYFLYGSLAAYFGVKDILTTAHTLKTSKPNIINEP